MEKAFIMKIGAKMKANKIQQMDLKPVSDLPAVLLVVNALFLVTILLILSKYDTGRFLHRILCSYMTKNSK